MDRLLLRSSGLNVQALLEMLLKEGTLDISGEAGKMNETTRRPGRLALSMLTFETIEPPPTADPRPTEGKKAQRRAERTAHTIANGKKTFSQLHAERWENATPFVTRALESTA